MSNFFKKYFLNSKESTVLFILVIVVRIVFFEVTKYISDDAYITYRYAANIAQGFGFVYNHSEKVQGTSSPLLTLLLAIGAWIFGVANIPKISFIISITCNCLTLLLLWKILGKFDKTVRFLACILFALYPKIVLINTSGMEASLVIFLMLLSWIYLQGQKFYFAFIVFSLLLLCRIDSMLWITVLLTLVAQWKLIPRKALLYFVFLYGGWLLFAQIYFGSWIPHSAIAKSISWNHLFPFFDPLRIFVGYFPFHGLQNVSVVVKSIVTAVFLSPVIIETIRLYKEKSPYLVFPIFFILYNLIFSFGRVLMTDWYYLPGYLTYIVSLSTLFNWFVQHFIAFFSKKILVHLIRGLIVITLVILLIIGMNRWKENPGGLFLRQNHALGVWLSHNAPEGSRVLVEPIGAIAWESDLYIYDYIGIVSPIIVDYRKRFPNSDSWYLKFIQEQRPDYLIMRNWEVPSNSLFHGFGDGIFKSKEDTLWFNVNYRYIPWNPNASSIDSVYLVLYQKTSP